MMILGIKSLRVIFRVKKSVSLSVIFFQFYIFRSCEVTLGKTHNDKFVLLIKQDHS